MCTVHIPAGLVELNGELAMPIAAQSVVLFAHSSGSRRLIPRNISMAELLLNSDNKFMLIPGATNLFEKPGTLQLAARADADWFAQHL